MTRPSLTRRSIRKTACALPLDLATPSVLRAFRSATVPMHRTALMVSSARSFVVSQVSYPPRILGRAPHRTLWVVIPGPCLVFAISCNDHIIAGVTLGALFGTLPMKIFNALRVGYTPVVAAAPVVFVAAAMLIRFLVAAFSDLPKLFGARRQ